MEIHLELRDVRAIALDVVELFRVYRESHPVELSVPDHDVLVPCDRLRLKQVLTNLVSNAIKYSYREGKVNGSPQ